ncbi:hypothetical protein WA158_004787 [Blastocystis sp. Blastoise]
MEVANHDCMALGCTQPAKYRCSNCKAVYYCSNECQRKDWPNHQKECIELQKQNDLLNETVDDASHSENENESNEQQQEPETSKRSVTKSPISSKKRSSPPTPQLEERTPLKSRSRTSRKTTKITTKSDSKSSSKSAKSTKQVKSAVKVTPVVVKEEIKKRIVTPKKSTRQSVIKSEKPIKDKEIILFVPPCLIAFRKAIERIVIFCKKQYKEFKLTDKATVFLSKAHTPSDFINITSNLNQAIRRYTPIQLHELPTCSNSLQSIKDYIVQIARKLGITSPWVNEFAEADIINPLSLYPNNGVERHFCTRCGSTNKLVDHPYFKTAYLCDQCFSFYNTGNWELSQGKDKYCRMCGDGGLVIPCQNCQRSMCDRCVLLHLGTHDWDIIKSKEQWHCIFCSHPESCISEALSQ